MSLEDLQLEAVSRYYTAPGGCIRGEKCFYAHGEAELQDPVKESLSTSLLDQGVSIGYGVKLSRIQHQSSKTSHSQDDLAKKIFVGGLSAAVESNDLKEFFQEKFGPVTEAIVIESHFGDQVHSRGFGFVTFESKRSVALAVQAHFINMFGKKVEIKSAVPRCMSPPLIQVTGRKTAESVSPPDEMNSWILEMSNCNSNAVTVTQRGLAVEASTLQTDDYLHPFHVDSSLSLSSSGKSVDEGTPRSIASPTRVASNGCKPGNAESQNWVPIFEQWLPEFLLKVCNRLQEGQWYPLSSLKGDFRATCGLELEHEAIGFHKLKDFIRSMPHLCRIKIVPVGRRPATHMVLLPVGASKSSPRQNGDLIPESSRASPALVEKGLSYATVACIGTEACGKTAKSLAHLPVPVGSSDNGILPMCESRMTDLGLGISTGFTSGVDGWKNICESASQRFTEQPNFLWDSAKDSSISMKPSDLLHVDRYLRCNDVLPGSLRRLDGPCSNITHNFSPDHNQDQMLTHNFGTGQIEMNVLGPDYAGLERALEQFTLTRNFSHVQSNGYELFHTDSQYKMGPEHDTIAQQTLSRAMAESTKVTQELPMVFSDLPSHNQVFLPCAPDKRGKAGVACMYCDGKATWVTFPCRHYVMCCSCRDSILSFWGPTVKFTCPKCAQTVEQWYALYS